MRQGGEVVPYDLMIIIFNVFLDIAAYVQDPVVQSPIKLILVERKF